MKSVIKDFLSRNKALIAFNIQNIYQLETLHDVSKKHGVPVIAQFSSKFIPHFDRLFRIENIVSKYQNDHFFFHLDHCLGEQLIKYCINAGFASVMFDGSSLPVNDNIRITNGIYEYASKKGCLLEAELGSISGVEDGFGSETGDYYSMDELTLFSENAKYDMLALAIGNAHGLYTSIENIKIEKLLVAKNILGNTPFVLHGGTGMPDELIYEAIKYGVVKINVSTALKIEHLKILSQYIQQTTAYDELKFSRFFANEIEPFYEKYILKFSK